MATQEGRILITHNVSNFPRILRDWAASGRSHAGVMLIYGIDHSEFDLIARGVERWLERRPADGEWLDLPAVVDRSWASG